MCQEKAKFVNAINTSQQTSENMVRGVVVFQSVGTSDV